MANLKDTIVLGNLTVTGSVNASSILSTGGNAFNSIIVPNQSQLTIDYNNASEDKFLMYLDDGTVTLQATDGGGSSGTLQFVNSGVYSSYFFADSIHKFGHVGDLQIGSSTENLILGAGNIKVGSSLLPNGTSINLGGSSNSWNNLYLSSSIIKGSYTLTLPSKTGTIALTSDCKNPANYYWANVKVSSSSNSSTSPTFAEVYSEYGNFEWVGAMECLHANNLFAYDRSAEMFIGEPDYGDLTPNYMNLTANDGMYLNVHGCTVTVPQRTGTMALLNDYWANINLSSTSSTTTAPQFLRAYINNAKRAVACDPRTTVTSTGDTSLVGNLPTGNSHLGLLTWDSESGFLGINGDNAIVCTPGDAGIFNTSGFLFILDEDTTFSNSSYKAYVDGNGAWKTNSDIRLKTNINNYPSVLEGIKQLDIITYTYIDQAQEKRSATEAKLVEAQEVLQRPLLSAKQAEEAQDTIKDCERILHRLNEKRDKVEIGLSAQQIEEKLPMPELFIAKNPDEQLGYKYTLSESKLVFAAIKAIQEQQTIIENQQKLIDNLTKEVATIKQTMTERGDSNE